MSRREKILTKYVFLFLQVFIVIFLITKIFLIKSQPTSLFIEPSSFSIDSKHETMSSPLKSISPGSYSLIVNYKTDSDFKCMIQTDGYDAFLYAKVFDLSKNKTAVQYDFYSLNKRISISFLGDDFDNILLSDVYVCKNNNIYKMLLFIFLVLSIALDFWFFSKLGEKYRKELLILLTISIISSLPCFIPGIYPGHDLGFHLGRIEGIAQGLKVGDFPVRMNAFFNDGYGFPVGLFYGDVLLYIPAFFRIIGFPVISAYKLFVFVINLLTSLSCYYCGKHIFYNTKIAYLISAVYTASSYRQTDIWVRGEVGEYSAMIFIPIIVLAVWKLYAEDKNEKSSSILLAVGMLGVLCTHIITTEIVIVSISVFALVMFKKTLKRSIIFSILRAIALFMLCGAWFIIPFVDYYLKANLNVKHFESSPHMIQREGAYISDYFAIFRNIFGISSELVTERMQLSPGLALMVTLIIAIILIIMRKANYKLKVFIIPSVIFLFMSTNLFPWDIIGRLPYVGSYCTAIFFPWRLIGIAIMPLSLLLGAVVEIGLENNAIKEIHFIYIGVVVYIMMCYFISMYSNSTKQYDAVDAPELKQYVSIDVGGNEYLLQGTDVASLSGEVIAENGKADIVSENGVDMVLKADVLADSFIEIPRFDYPNYEAVSENNDRYTIVCGNNNKIRILIPHAYKGNIYIRFKKPMAWRVAELVSIITFIILIINYLKGIKIRENAIG